MCDLDIQLLAAYHDGELGPADRARVESHLLACASCATELRLLRETSRRFADERFDDLAPDELARLHAAIDEAESDRPLLRIAGAIGVIAASILIVSCAWLMDLPRGTSGASGNAVATR